MDNAVRISAAAMTVRMQQHELTAQNSSNIDTDYYKSRELFYVNSDDDTPEASETTDLSGGALRTTKNPMDVVLGKKYFMKAADDEGNIYYIKDGRLSLNSSGELTYQGMKILNTSGTSIKVQSLSDFKITQSGDCIENNSVIDRIDIVQTGSQAKITPQSNGTFTIDEGGVEAPTGYALISQGMREGSNVSRVNEMIKMVNTLSSYESNQKMIQANDDAVSRAIAEFGKF
jgi:flagellar basal body rod protein FlgG